MRLIQASSLRNTNAPIFQEIFDSSSPTHSYIILSHRWGSDELTYQDVVDDHLFWENSIFDKAGYKKLQEFADVVIENYEFEWIWCDTCCIDKSNAAELSEAINSMWKWYRDAKVCVAYLEDWSLQEVGTGRAFTESVWFTRCWTLQELIAPVNVHFYDCDWNLVGYKMDLAREISEKTRIDPMVLRGEPLNRFSIAQRMSWAADRNAAKKEDEAYSLLGIFGVSMPMLYGEGRNAFLRLQEEIIRRNPDQSIFVWESREASKNLLASSPADFAGSDQIHQTPRLECPFSVNNLGLEIELELRQIRSNTYAAYLACEHVDPNNAVSLILEYEPGTSYFYRIQSDFPQEPEKCSRYLRKSRKVTIKRDVPETIFLTRPLASLYGFCLGGGCRSLLLINNWDQHRYWDHGEWKADFRSTRQPWPYPIFVIPDGEAPSIASMILFIGKTRVLIHLMYDFDFRPCCYVSRYTQSAGDVFYLRGSSESRSEEKMAWLEDEFSISKGARGQSSHVELDKKHPYTGEPGWAAKSLHRGGFKATIPRTVTKPYRDVEVSFSPHRESGDWVFDVDLTNVKHDQVTGELSVLDFGFPIVKGDHDLQDLLMHSGLEFDEQTDD